MSDPQAHDIALGTPPPSEASASTRFVWTAWAVLLFPVLALQLLLGSAVLLLAASSTALSAGVAIAACFATFLPMLTWARRTAKASRPGRGAWVLLSLALAVAVLSLAAVLMSSSVWLPLALAIATVSASLTLGLRFRAMRSGSALFPASLGALVTGLSVFLWKIPQIPPLKQSIVDAIDEAEGPAAGFGTTALLVMLAYLGVLSLAIFLCSTLFAVMKSKRTPHGR